MKTVNNVKENYCQYNDNDTNNLQEEVTDLLINKKGGQNLIECKSNLIKSYNVLKPTPVVNKPHFCQRVLLKYNVTKDSRSQSLPTCCLEQKNQTNGNLNTADSDIQNKLLSEHDSPPQSPTSEVWFKTWPERYDKIKCNDDKSCITANDMSDSTIKLYNTQTNNEKCDIVDNGNIKNKLSLNEALQNISLAYSPITRQLHLVEQLLDTNNIAEELTHDNKLINNKTNCEQIKKGHKRIEAGSFSSTISSLSDSSPSGSLLDDDEKSLTNFEEHGTKPRKRSLTNFFSRNVFSWKTNPSAMPSTVWKLFSKQSKNNISGSPHHVVASSTALIQHARPSNLPAKDLEEEQRHREEYKAIIAAVKKKEAQNSVTRQKLQKLQLQQEEHHAAVTKHFTQYVLPNWDLMHTNKKTKELWWQGLPSSIRGKVWRLAIGNELNVSSQLYEICLLRAQNRLNSSEPSQCELDIDQESSMDVIQLDISRTFPHLCIFQEGGPYSDVLHSLLAAYVCYRPDVGYVQGMSYIAAVLILNMEQFDAFICFANLLNQPLHLSAFTLNQNQMQIYYNAYNEIFNYNLPKLYMHFENCGLTPDLYLVDWIYTIFAKAMPLDIACRVWDIFLRDGYEFIFRTALGILHLNQDVLMNMDFLHGAQFLTRLPDDMSSHQLFKSIQAITTSIGKQSFYQIVEKCNFTLNEFVT